MSCEFENELTAYVDGELPSLRLKQVEGHLPACKSCRATEGLLRQTVSQLKTLPAFEPSPSVRRAVLAKLDEPPRLWERARAWLLPVLLVPSAGLVAAGIIAVASSGNEPEVRDAETLMLAMNLELMEDYELLGVESAEDLEVISRLDELEAKP